MKVTVQKAYLVSEQTARRVLADSQGRVFLPERRDWQEDVAAEVIRIGDVYEAWPDVPEAWCGVVPWWPSVVTR